MREVFFISLDILGSLGSPERIERIAILEMFVILESLEMLESAEILQR